MNKRHIMTSVLLALLLLMGCGSSRRGSGGSGESSEPDGEGNSQPGSETGSPLDSGTGDDLENESDSSLPLRPGDIPEVVIFFVSGHKLGFPNTEYLCTNDQLDDMLCDMFSDALGWDCAVACYIDAFDNPSPTSPGFLQLVDDWHWYNTTVVSQYRNPPRVILAGHSHGATWAHNLAFENWVNPAMQHPFDFLIDYDAEASFWEDEWTQEIRDQGWFGYWTIDDPDNPQQYAQDIPDMVPPAPMPEFNIEIRACRIPAFPEDETYNYRVDYSSHQLMEYDYEEGETRWEGEVFDTQLYADIQTLDWWYQHYGEHAESGATPWQTDDCIGHSAVHKYPPVTEIYMWDLVVPVYEQFIADYPGLYDY